MTSVQSMHPGGGTMVVGLHVAAAPVQVDGLYEEVIRDYQWTGP